MERRARTRLLTALTLVVVFASGVLVGMAADGGPGEADAVTQSRSGERGEDRDRGEERRRTPIYERVGPTPEQRARIDSIVQQHQARLQELNREFRSQYQALRDAYDPRYQALIRETREAIKAVLTPEQAAEYQKLLDDWDRRREERERKREENHP